MKKIHLRNKEAGITVRDMLPFAGGDAGGPPAFA